MRGAGAVSAVSQRLPRMDESAEKELAEVKPGRERRPPFTLRDI